MLCVVHERADLGEPAAQLIGHHASLLVGIGRTFLGKHRGDGGADHALLSLGVMRQRVALCECTRQRCQVALSTIAVPALMPR